TQRGELFGSWVGNSFPEALFRALFHDLFHAADCCRHVSADLHKIEKRQDLVTSGRICRQWSLTQIWWRHRARIDHMIRTALAVGWQLICRLGLGGKHGGDEWHSEKRCKATKHEPSHIHSW